MSEALVIGAAGKTGRAVTGALVSLGVGVRAAVRPGSTSAVYAGELVRAVPVDLVDGSGLREALRGVTGVYHLAPNVHPDEVGMAMRVAEAAAAEGVSRFVFHSVMHPDDASMVHHLRKAEAEVVVRRLHPGATVLRPAAYHQNLEGAARAGEIAVPYSLDSPFTNVDLRDVAEVAAMALTESGHAGATYELSGGEVMSVRDLARCATEVLGRAVEAVRTPLPEWAAGPGSALSTQARDDLVAMFTAYDRDGFVGDAATLRGLLGREPRTWQELLAS